ncbi:MAG: ribonuclease HII, partial [Bacteriovoracaceae bacterium]|nr:ribonuclease HII [Bacteriovoracaceae bacterium]
EVTAAEIDRLHILQAAVKAMQLAVESAQQALGTGALTLLADGNFTPPVAAAQKIAVVKGDQRSLLIALASIIAKEYRDYLMQKWDAQYPQYGWAQNAGYPTKAHRQALQQFGPCPLHRKSFHGVREFCPPGGAAES